MQCIAAIRIYLSDNQYNSCIQLYLKGYRQDHGNQVTSVLSSESKIVLFKYNCYFALFSAFYLHLRKTDGVFYARKSDVQLLCGI